MIEAKNLRKKYAPKKGVEVHALDNVSLRLPDTGMVFVLGKSGSGKSTLLNVLGGLDTIDSGEIFIKGQSSKEFKQSHFDSYRNTYVGFIFQEYNILEEFTVGANIALAIELQGRKATNEEINGILNEVDLGGLGARKPNELSGGQKQRVAIARALVKKPEIIMADEPTGALDSNTGRQVFDTLKELSKKKLVLIVSHDREFSELYADRIIELADGKIISDVEYDKEATESTEEPNLSYVGKEITIKDGYELTDEDRIAINDYIKKIKGNASLIINDKRQNKIFKNTDESKIPERSSKDFKLIKSKLSIKNAFKLGSSGLKYKKVRLVFTILLSFIAFSLFGLADSIASYDSIETCTESLMDSSIDYASFVKEVKSFYSDGSLDYYWDKYDKRISKDEVSILEEQTGLKFLPVLGGNSLQLSYSKELAESNDPRYDWSSLYPKTFSGVATLDEAIISNFGYTLYGKLPSAKNEIVISKYVADSYVKCGYIEYNDSDNTSETITIPTANDMIGREITVELSYNFSTSKFKIVGILDTGFDPSRYEALADTRADSSIMTMALQGELDAVKSSSLNAVMFIHQDLLNETTAFINQNKYNVRNGNFEIIKYKNKDASLDDSNYFSWPQGYSLLTKLSQLQTTEIAWLTDEPCTSLNQFDVLLSLSEARSIVTNEIYVDDGIDGSKEPSVDIGSVSLVGIENDYVSRYGGDYIFGNIFYNLERVAAYEYALVEENWDTIIASIKTIEPTFDENNCQIDDGTGNLVIDKDQIRNIFVNYSIELDEKPYNFEKYYGEMLLRYPKEKDYFLTFEQYNDRSITLFDGSEYQFFHGIDKNSYESSRNEIIVCKLANSTFEQDYKSAESSEEKPSWFNVHSLYDSFNAYKNQVSSLFFSFDSKNNNIELSDERIAQINKASIEFFIEEYSELIKSNIAIRYSTYAKGETLVESKDARVVGIILDSSTKIVVSDEIYSVLVDEISDGEYSYVVAPMPKDRAGVNDIAKFSYENAHYDGMAKFSLKNSVTEELGMIDEMLEILGQVFLWVGVGFAVFASLMLSNFIATSISHKKQEIGILRAIGSRSSDVFMIFFAESFIIAMINFVLSLITTGAIVYVLNSIFRNDIGLLVTFLTFGIRQVVLLLLVSLVVAVIATFLPVKKIASMKPIDAIKNRK